VFGRQRSIMSRSRWHIRNHQHSAGRQGVWVGDVVQILQGLDVDRQNVGHALQAIAILDGIHRDDASRLAGERKYGERLLTAARASEGWARRGRGQNGQAQENRSDNQGPTKFQPIIPITILVRPNLKMRKPYHTDIQPTTFDRLKDGSRIRPMSVCRRPILGARK
jgi:hypothetical protein